MSTLAALNSRAAARRGLTLVELIVASTIMVVVVGLGYRIASSSEEAGARITRRQTAILYCQTALQRIAEAASAAVDPSAVNAVANRTPLTPVLTQSQLGILQYLDFEGPALAQTLIQQQDATPKAPASLILKTQPLAETATGAVVASTQDLGGVASAGFTPSLEFGYAAAPAPGQAAVYAPTWTESGLPDLIRITIRARFDAPEENAIELQTAVIPGFVRTVSAAAATSATATSAMATSSTATLVPAAAATPAPAQTPAQEPAP